jgi:hypothetical protein
LEFYLSMALFNTYKEFVISLNIALFITIILSKLLSTMSLTSRTIFIAAINVTVVKYIYEYLNEIVD